MDWLLYVVIGILVLGAVIGFARGAVRIAVSLAATLLSILLVFFVTPYVQKAVEKFTPVDEMIEEQCMDTILRAIGGDAASGNGLSEETVRAMLDGAGVDEAQLAAQGITVQDIVEGRISGEDLTQFGISAGILSGHISEETDPSILDAEIPRQVQIEAIQSADLPQVFKDLLQSNNNNEVYQSLGVSSFAEYIGSYLSHLLIGIISFLLAFLVVTIIVRAVVFALDFVTELPVLGILNRLAGIFVGALVSLIIVDFLFVIITLLYIAPFGKPMMEAVNASPFLSFLYDHNFIMKITTIFR